MTLFKDPNSYNYAFYGAIIVLAVIGSLFFGEPASPEHLTNKSEEFIETKISSISTSPERKDTILLVDPFNY